MPKKKNKSQAKIKQVIRSAGTTISNKEMNKIVKAAGGNVSKALNRISSVQANMKAKDQRAPSIGSGAANRLIKQASTPVGRSSLGNSSVAQAIRSMAGRPAGPMRQGQQTAAIPGTRVPPGMVVRPSGRVGTRQQPKPSQTTRRPGPYDGMMDGAGPGPGPGGLTQEELDSLINERVNAGIDEYLTNFGLNNQTTYDPFAGLGELFATAMAPYQQSIQSSMDLMGQFAMQPDYGAYQDFSMPAEQRQYGAGFYNIGGVRAPQRKRPTGYLRNKPTTGTTGVPALSSGMTIGSALATPGGVTI